VLRWRVTDRNVRAIPFVLQLVCLTVATAAAPDEWTRFEQPHLAGAAILGTPLIASVMIEHTDSGGEPRSEFESRRAVFYRSSDGKTRTDMFMGISGDHQGKPNFIEITNVKRRIMDVLVPSSGLDHRIAVQEVPFIMAGGASPDK
jgi:hypothetical protein